MSRGRSAFHRKKRSITAKARVPIRARLGEAFLYSDGVTEAENPAGEELGFGRLQELVREEAVSPDSLFASLARFTAGRQRDDVTLVSLRRATGRD